MWLCLRLVGGRGGSSRGSTSQLAELHAAAHLGEACKTIDGEHKRGILIRRKGNIVDEAAALALALDKDGGLLDAAGAARSANLADVALSSAGDARPRIHALLDAELLLNAEALLGAGAAHEGGEIGPDHGVAAAASAEHKHIGGINISHFCDW